MYAYDNAGNITSKAKYAFTTGTLGTATEIDSFTYSSSTWGDKLTGHGENTFEYDAIGNPTRIDFNDGTDWYSGYDLTWQGRQLMSYTPFDEVTGDTSSQTSVSYTYNVDGIRTSKIVDGVEHRYLLDGAQIVSETWTVGTTEHLIVYLYDETGSPIGLRYRTNAYATNVYDSYFFDKNLQGDIVAVYNASGTKIGSYTYDAWGVCTATTYTSSSLERTIVTTYNPFRYRGYYYDVETELYYLQTRYYNPEICRFLNADVYISTGQGLLGYNMYAYCRNNPVSRKDRLGTDDIDVTDGDDEDNVFDDLHFSPGGGAGGNSAYRSSSNSGSTNSSSTKSGSNYSSSAKSGSNYSTYVKSASTYKSSVKSSYSGNVCFIAGTLIATASGHKAIEDIREGDLVWATNPETGETELKEVVRLFRNETDEWIHITVNGETLTCTPEHPFYSPVKGWTNAVHLRAGDILVMLNGEYVVVAQVQHELLESPEKTYNFEVKDFHTYYVGDTEVLVHNRCDYKAPKGGGGVSDSIQIGNTKVTFGHGGRHINGRLDIGDVNRAIANDVVTKNLPLGAHVKYFDISFNGQNIHYGAIRLSDFVINVGTYYVIK